MTTEATWQPCEKHSVYRQQNRKAVTAFAAAARRARARRATTETVVDR